MSTNTTLTADAKNRAARTFLQGLAVDVAVALCSLVLISIDDISTRQGLIVLGVAAIKTVLTTVASYVMRRYADGSMLPTPLPPAVAGLPAVPVAPAVWADHGTGNAAVVTITHNVPPTRSTAVSMTPPPQMTPPTTPPQQPPTPPAAA